MMGYSVDELLGKYRTFEGDSSLIHPEDRQMYAELMNQIPTDTPEELYEITYRVIRADGAIRHLRELGELVHDPSGKLIKTIGTVQDVTEKELTTSALRESESKLAHAARTAKLGYWTFDSSNECYLEISEEYASIFGNSVDDFLARFPTLADDLLLVHPADRARITQAYKEMCYTSGIEDLEYRIVRADRETRWVREIVIGHFSIPINVDFDVPI